MHLKRVTSPQFFYHNIALQLMRIITSKFKLVHIRPFKKCVPDPHTIQLGFTIIRSPEKVDKEKYRE